MSGRLIVGRFDAHNTRVEFHKTQTPGDCDPMDYAARQALKNGGRLFLLERREDA